MQYCPNCFCGIDEEDEFCKNCGEPLHQDVEEKNEITDAPVEAVKTTDTAEEDKVLEQSETDNDQTKERSSAFSDNGGDSAKADAGGEITLSEPSDYTKTFIHTDHQTEKDMTSQNDDEKIVSMGDWVLTLFLTYIPIVNLIMLIYWAVSDTTNPNKKNFARAHLIWTAVSIVISIILIIVLISVGIAAATSYSVIYY